jgi:hypothetical protein
MKRITQALLLISLTQPLTGCFSDDDLTAIEKACGNQSLEDIQNNNAQGISQECRNAIESALDAEYYTEYNSLVTREINGGLIVWGATENGDTINTSNLEVRHNGELLEASQYQWNQLQTSDIELTVSYVIDYSGSMQETDLQDAADITRQLNQLLPDATTSNVIIFSETSQTLSEGNNKEATDIALGANLDFERSSTALFDAIQNGINLMSFETTTPINLLVLVTDGYENASTLTDKASVLAELEENSIWVLSLGSLFADHNTLSELTSGRGFYVKSAKLLTLKERILTMASQLKNLHQLELTGSTDISNIKISLAE